MDSFNMQQRGRKGPRGGDPTLTFLFLFFVFVGGPLMKENFNRNSVRHSTSELSYLPTVNTESSAAHLWKGHEHIFLFFIDGNNQSFYMTKSIIRTARSFMILIKLKKKTYF